MIRFWLKALALAVVVVAVLDVILQSTAWWIGPVGGAIGFVLALAFFEIPGPKENA